MSEVEPTVVDLPALVRCHPYTSSYEFAGSCVFGKQLPGKLSLRPAPHLGLKNALCQALQKFSLATPMVLQLSLARSRIVVVTIQLDINILPRATHTSRMFGAASIVRR